MFAYYYHTRIPFGACRGMESAVADVSFDPCLSVAVV